MSPTPDDLQEASVQMRAARAAKVAAKDKLDRLKELARKTADEVAAADKQYLRWAAVVDGAAEKPAVQTTIDAMMEAE